MLTVPGPAHRYCDGLTRRGFLTAGAAAGLTLPTLMRAEAAAGRRSHKSVIMVYLTGGMAHQDTFDLKPNAPAEVRGTFNPIRTNLTGVTVCEHLPMLARCMDKVAVLRSLVGQRDEHSSWQSYTATTMDTAKRENKPHFGSVVARLQGQTDPVVPAFVDLSPTMQHRPYNSPGAALLGRAAAPVKVDGDEIGVMRNLVVPQTQLADRRALLGGLDAMRRSEGGSTDTFHDRAFDVLASNKVVDALDVTKEPERVRERYGRGSPRHQGDGAPQWNDQLLMARRLVEAGARVVTVAYGFWDTHGNNFKSLERQLPLFDRGVSALVEDIHVRGMDKDCLVVVWGEFGRTPKINKDAGRDHWARVNFALMSGGGLKTGQVIGTTDAQAGEAKTDAIPYPNVLATTYHALGIDPHAMVYDVSNRPNPILPGSAQVIDKLV
ncbi:MAG: DUF1501 domain-containing protein [Gemmataceae bacterium]